MCMLSIKITCVKILRHWHCNLQILLLQTACGNAPGRETARTMHHWLDTAWAPASPPQLFPCLSAYKRQTYCPCHLLLCCTLQSRAAPLPQRGQAAMASLTSVSESYWPDLLSPAGQTEAPSMQMQLNMISEKNPAISSSVQTQPCGYYQDFFFSMGNSLLINMVCAIL